MQESPSGDALNLSTYKSEMQKSKSMAYCLTAARMTTLRFKVSVYRVCDVRGVGRKVERVQILFER